MSWETETVEILRVMINDLATTPKYDDERLQRILIVAGTMVVSELDFTQDFVVDVGEADIVPDPTVTATRDDNFVNLLCIKAACLIDRGEARKAASTSISFSENGSSVDMKGAFQAQLELLKQGWCAVYEEAKVDYITGSSTMNVGAAIVGPFRTYASGGGGSTIYGGNLQDRNDYFR